MRIAIFLLLILTLSLSAQDHEPPKSITIAVEAAPEFGPKSFNNSLGDVFILKTGIGFVGNLIVTKHVVENISIKGGIGYKNKNFEFNFDGLIFGSCIDPLTGIVIESSGSLQTSLHYLFLPVGIIYKISDNFNLDIGFDTDLLIHKKSIRDISEPVKDPLLLTIEPANKKVLTSLFLGAHVKLHDHIYIKPFANTRFDNDNSLNFFSLSNLEFTSGLKVGWLFK